MHSFLLVVHQQRTQIVFPYTTLFRSFRAALTRTVNAYATKNSMAGKLSDSISGDDIREGMTAVISIKIPQPQFEGQRSEEHTSELQSRRDLVCRLLLEKKSNATAFAR